MTSCPPSEMETIGTNPFDERETHDPQVTMLALVDLEERVPKDHPLRTIKAVADEALERLSAEFDRMYSKVGRASVPPERLLKASLLISLYSVRSERAFCEEFEYNLLFRWFLDMNLMERSFDPTVFTKNRRRLLEHRVGQALFDEVLLEADRRGLLSDEHFSVDGTLIEAAEDVIARNLYCKCTWSHTEGPRGSGCRRWWPRPRRATHSRR